LDDDNNVLMLDEPYALVTVDATGGGPWQKRFAPYAPIIGLALALTATIWSLVIQVHHLEYEYTPSILSYIVTGPAIYLFLFYAFFAQVVHLRHFNRRIFRLFAEHCERLTYEHGPDGEQNHQRERKSAKQSVLLVFLSSMPYYIYGVVEIVQSTRPFENFLRFFVSFMTATGVLGYVLIVHFLVRVLDFRLVRYLSLLTSRKYTSDLAMSDYLTLYQSLRAVKKQFQFFVFLLVTMSAVYLISAIVMLYLYAFSSGLGSILIEYIIVFAFFVFVLLFMLYRLASFTSK
jgi:hypothetical protein